MVLNNCPTFITKLVRHRLQCKQGIYIRVLFAMLVIIIIFNFYEISHVKGILSQLSLSSLSQLMRPLEAKGGGLIFVLHVMVH